MRYHSTHIHLLSFHHSFFFLFFRLFQSRTISQVTTSYQRYLPAIPPLIHLLWLKGFLLAIDKEYQNVSAHSGFRCWSAKTEVGFCLDLEISHYNLICFKVHEQHHHYPALTYQIVCWVIASTHAYINTLTRSPSLVIETQGNDQVWTQHTASLTSSHRKTNTPHSLEALLRVTLDKRSYTQGWVNTHTVMFGSLFDYTHTRTHKC